MIMLTTVIAIFVLNFTVTYGRILLYHTENSQEVEKFDCVYHVYDHGEEISYCRRPGGTQSLNRDRNECDNQGEKKLFRDLIYQAINPSDVFKWSSSVEMADMYAHFFYNQSVIEANDDHFLCNCTKRGTFGKYCEYQLTHEAETFGEAINAQFETKRNGDSWNTQRYGKILCYETLSCSSSPLCLDWREISDGTQRCSNGTDEENWDKLEFNECEDNEFRCTNGMCIPEEFWLDGYADCMDWSDELYHESGESCSFTPNTMQCDEHICPRQSYSCGDGQCVPWQTRMAFQRVVRAANDCFNKRNLNYMCEVSPHQPAWTLENGLCSPDKDYNDPRYPPWNTINASKLTDDEKCHYLFRCVLSKGFEHDCPCNHQNCTQMMMNVCSRSDHLILFPSYGLINPNVFVMYNYSHSMENPSPQFFLLSEGLKCRGFFFQAKSPMQLWIGIQLIISPLINHVLCTIDDPDYGYRDYLSPHQNDKFCWNDSLTFNGRPYAVNPDICTTAGECISQYRILDGSQDCFDQQDEAIVLDKNYCTANAGRHRFQCFNDEHKCLPLISLGTGHADCSNSYDESWYGTGTNLRLQLSCSKESTTDCHLVKAYIQQSSTRNSSNNNSLVNPQQQEPVDRMPFRHYCDSFWNLDKYVDEMSSSCQYWVCQQNQYQCRTGQCIDLDWVCDGEWDCSDASDEEAILLTEKWSMHNARLSNLPSQVEKCRRRYSKSPFSNICNTSFELGCYVSRVSNPLDIQSNRPCINLTQIGDGVEDCYNAYDEKNTFTSNSDMGGMWGFHFRCGNDHISYPTACERQRNCTQILCSQYRDQDGSCSGKNDFICLGDNQCKKNARCNGILDCFHGEDEYWCSSGSLVNQMKYRNDKMVMSRPSSLLDIPQFPPHQNMLVTRQKQLLKPIVNPRNDQSFTVHSYICNRGVAVVEMNETRCLCPPAYYGDRCQFFSDRISVIAQIDQNTLPIKPLKIKAKLLFENKIIDDHEFTVIPTIENLKKIKHRFYLLYSRSAQMLSHKQRRYFNRSDVINYHPYSVHFDVFSLEQNNNVKELGSWRYPIYFDYLPAYRLAVVLKFPAWFLNNTGHPCSQNPCNENSNCMPVFNQNNSYYCSCKSGYFGTDCHLYEPRCETYCSANALCRINADEMNYSKTKPYCICPLNDVGPHCSLKHNDCYSNPCLNHGTCLPIDDRSGEVSYMCRCSMRFYGNRCQNEMGSVHVNLNMTHTSSVRATVVQLYDFQTPSFQLLLQHQQVYQGIPSTINYYHSDIHAPLLGLLKIYEDLIHPQYFIMYSFAQRSRINITSSPEYCPHASLLLPKDVNKSLSPVFLYHLICHNDSQRLCFHDENYLCICQSDHYRAECFIHDTQIDHCNKCLSGGKCLQGDINDSNDFICICPPSYYGRLCQFRTTTNADLVTTTNANLITPTSKAVVISYISVTFLLFNIAFLYNIYLFNHI